MSGFARRSPEQIPGRAAPTFPRVVGSALEGSDSYGQYATWTSYSALRDARDMAKGKDGRSTKFEALINGEEPWSVSTRTKDGREKSEWILKKENEALQGYANRLYDAQIVRASIHSAPDAGIFGYRVAPLDERDVVVELAKYDQRWSISSLEPDAVLLGFSQVSVRFEGRKVVSLSDHGCLYVVGVVWGDEQTTSHNNAEAGFTKIADAIKWAVERERW